MNATSYPSQSVARRLCLYYHNLLSNISFLSSVITLYVCKARAASWNSRKSTFPPELQVIFGWLVLSLGHTRRICRILCSEWWDQVQYFKDCLEIACTKNERHFRAFRKYQEWSSVTVQVTEFLWYQIRLTLPSKKKMPNKEEKIVILGKKPIPEHHQLLLKNGLKFCFEPGLTRINKLAM